MKRDWPALALTPALTLLALPLVGSLASWASLTVAGLAMGVMTFLMASGLTLIFGLMDVLTFAHGAFVAFGAYCAVALLPAAAAGTPVWALAAAAVAAMVAAGALGVVFERVIIRPVYRQHTKQILITMGAMVVAEQVIIVLWGANPIPVARPSLLRGALVWGDAAFEVYRLWVMVLGLLIFGLLRLVLTRTRLGLLVRAGVEAPQMVEALGYPIRRIFLGVFVAGCALAALGGVMWAFYRGELTPAIGTERTIDIFISVIIGGLGSMEGCLIASLLAALLFNYLSFFAPALAGLSSVLLLMAMLLWRPQGLFAKSGR